MKSVVKTLFFFKKRAWRILISFRLILTEHLKKVRLNIFTVRAQPSCSWACPDPEAPEGTEQAAVFSTKKKTAERSALPCKTQSDQQSVPQAARSAFF